LSHFSLTIRGLLFTALDFGSVQNLLTIFTRKAEVRLIGIPTAVHGTQLQEPGPAERLDCADAAGTAGFEVGGDGGWEEELFV